LAFVLQTYGAQSRFEKIIEKSKDRGIFEIESVETLQAYAQSKHNFSLFVLFSTSDPNVQCPACRPSMDQFSKLGQEFLASLGKEKFKSQKFLEHPVFFAYCDILKFREWILQSGIVRELPSFVVFPVREVKEDNLAYLPMEGMSVDFSSERMAQFVSDRSGYQMVVEASQLTYILMYGAAAVIILSSLWAILPAIKENFQRTNFWFSLSVGVYAFVMAGTVFNSINGPPPYYKHPQTGQLYLIYPSSRQQFVYEGLMLAGLMTFVSLTLVGFGAIVPKIKGAGKQRSLFALIAVSFYISYYAFMKVFKVKYPWYPFNY